MNELKTYRDLFQASLDGHDIEYWNEYRGEWMPSIGGWYFNSRNLDKEIEINKYRIKITYPSVDWSHVSDEYRYLAKDMDGSVHLYKEKPETVNYSWSIGHRDFINASIFKSLNVGNCDWKDSLVERPKG